MALKRLIPLLCALLVGIPAMADNCANVPAPATLAWNGLEAVPQNGWNADSSASTTEAIIKAQADLLVSTGLKAAGYTMVQVSDWWAQRSGSAIIPDATTFPDGMAATFSYIHADGLLAGIYSSPAATTCGNYAGSETFEASDASTFASWGADALWYDGCSPLVANYSSCWSTKYQQVWQLMAQDIRATGRPMILIMGTNQGPEQSGLQYDLAYGWSWASQAGYNEFYPNNGGDLITNGWSQIVGNFLQSAMGFYKFERPGYFPFCESLLGQTAYTGLATLTQSQSQAQMGLYALWGCPLRLDMDLSTLSTAMLNIFKNSGVIAVDQDSLAHAAILYQQFTCGTSTCQVWVKPLKGGNWAMGLLNLDSASHTVAVSFANFGGSPDVTDLWAGTDLGTMTSYSATVPPCTTTNQCIEMIKVVPAGTAHTITNTQLENMAIQ